MNAEITIKNYRCFPDSRPARFVIRDGFTSFVGVNNSGKSSLLRFFYELRHLFGTISAPNQQFVSALHGSPQVFSPNGDMEGMFYNGNDRQLQITLKVAGLSERIESGLTIPESFEISVPRTSNTYAIEASLRGGPGFNREQVDLAGTVLRVGGVPKADIAPFLALCQDLTSTVYIGPFRNAINVGAMGNYFDISVGQAFIQAWRNLKTGSSRRMNEAIYQLTEDIRRIFDFRQLEINPSPDDQTLKFLVNGRSYALDELGSGLAQFVLVLANAATKRPAFILVDEPEAHLHPSLQLDFLTTLGSYASRGVLFATHSYGLARARAHQVYTVMNDSDAGSEVKQLESNPRLSELLGELSFSAFRELGFDKILLVEGVTEVLTLQQWLRLYQKDHQIVLLPLGGSNFINGRRELELQEILRISSQVSALIDSERNGQSDPLEQGRADFVATCQKVGVPCHVLDRRATENYLTDAAVKGTMGHKHRALTPYERLNAVSPCWSKDDNWRIARAMILPDIQNTDLGQFLASL